MRELIERLEKATRPNRELDYRIAYQLGWRFNGFEWDKQSRDQEWLSNKQFRDLHRMAGGWKRPGQKKWPYPGTNENEVPQYTASIDAAMTLLPPDTRIVLTGCNQSWHVALNSTPQEPRHPPRDGFASSAAIAICIAALGAALTSGDQSTDSNRRA